MKNLKHHKLFKALALIMTMILIIGTLTACGGKEEEETTEPTTTLPSTTEADVIRNPLTGDTNYKQSMVKNRPVFISVENHPDARPQWGITTADIVWEMEVEGGITRMLLMYADASRIPDKVGPTRSARHYFVELVEGFDAIFVHFGGSPLAYNYINNHGVDHIDGMSDSGFSRDSYRSVSSEHIAYTTKDGVVSNIENKEIRTKLESDYVKPFKFNNKKIKLADGACTELTVPFSSAYTYTLTYNEDEKVYYSALKGNAFMDDNGTQQHFDNIVVLYSNVSSLGDSKGRVTFDLSEGKGVYVSNGTYENITWEKGEATDMLKLYNADGDELKLNPGRSYFALVDTDNEVTVK